MFPPIKNKIKAKAKIVGIKHYTSYENVDSILSSGLIKAAPMEHSYFFVNEPIPRDILRYNLRYVDKNGKRRMAALPTSSSIAGKSVAIIIRNLSDEQIKQLRYLHYQQAVYFKGDFKFRPENKVIVEKADFSTYPKRRENGSVVWRAIKLLNQMP